MSIFVYKIDPRDRGMTSRLFRKKADASNAVWHGTKSKKRRVWKRRHARMDDAFARIAKHERRVYARAKAANVEGCQFITMIP